MANYFDDVPDDDAAKLGQHIYRTALADRRGFRPDQIGIPEEDDVWLEIFHSIGQAAASPPPQQEAKDE